MTHAGNHDECSSGNSSTEILGDAERGPLIQFSIQQKGGNLYPVEHVT